MKKLVILSQLEIDYIKNIARTVSTPGHCNFSRGLRKIIEDHIKLNTEQKIQPITVKIE